MNFLPSREIVWIGLAAATCLVASVTLSLRESSPFRSDSSLQMPAVTSTLSPSTKVTRDTRPVHEEPSSAEIKVPPHDVELDIHGALAAFGDALAQSGDELPQADRDQVDRLMTNLRLHAEAEGSEK